MSMSGTVTEAGGGLTLVQALAGARFGGAESFYTRLVTALEGTAGIRQHAVLRDWPERTAQLRSQGVAVHPQRFGGRLDLLDHYRYRRLLRQLDPDVVLTYMNRASLLTPPGDYKLVCRLGHFYDLKYYRHADYWIGNTRGICDHLVRGGMPADRVMHIANFVDESPVESIAPSTLGLAEGEPRLLAAGRLHTNKGFDILIRAMAELPGVHLLLAGEGPEREPLQRLAREQGVDARVHFLGWRNDVGALMRSVDAFVCPSRHEGLGGIVLEAWFHGCPIIATCSQGPAELIEDGDSGVLTPLDDVPALADAIRALLGDFAAARSLAERGAARYREAFSQEVIVGQYADLLHSIAGRPPGQSRGVSA